MGGPPGQGGNMPRGGHYHGSKPYYEERKSESPQVPPDYLPHEEDDNFHEVVSA